MRTAGRLLAALTVSATALAVSVVPAASEVADEKEAGDVDDDDVDDAPDPRPVASPAEVDGPAPARASASGRRAAPATPAPATPAPATPAPAPRAPTERRVATAASAPRTVTEPAAGAPAWHVVESGQTLSSIARLHGCAAIALQQANRLEGTLIRPGQRLQVPPCAPGTRLPPISVVTGQSVGQPWNGVLHGGVPLPASDGYFIRRPRRAWGASHVVAYIERAVAAVRSRFPRLHTLAIGDLSARRGGVLTEHRSHQSGRDVDVGLFFRAVPRGYPQTFVAATDDNLDCAATWALLHAFARTADEPGGVAAIFLDFDVQGQLYDWALDHGVPADYLARLFQYPHGDGAMVGLVRHEPNHADHLHVRFKCPPGDGGCW